MGRRASTLVLAGVVAACGSEANDAGRVVERETRGDTTVVRTRVAGPPDARGFLVEELRIGSLSGSDETAFGRIASLAIDDGGSIYVLDAHLPALRKFGPDGTFLATLGREGGGPGEYRAPDGGLAVLPDGRVVLRDPGNGRFQTYHADGAPASSWVLRSGLHTSSPLVVDTAGDVYSIVAMARTPEDRSYGMLGYDPATGEPLDTLPAPTAGLEPPYLSAIRQTPRGPARSDWNVPFAPSSHWAMSPLGYMVGGDADRYAIDLQLPAGRVRRIELDRVPVGVQREEGDDAARYVSERLRALQPDWSWNGPPIPDTKPAFSLILTGLDGRLWVRAPQPGVRVPADELDTVDGDAPVHRWREPIAFDVFEPDGAYVGRYRAPDGFALLPRPVFRGDHVWAVIRDELNVSYVARFRLMFARTEAR